MRIMGYRQLWLWAALATPLQTIASQEGESPRLHLRDSVVLVESESRYVGHLNGFAISASGRFYVLDVGNIIVHEFASDGRPLRTFGRRGNGPGEFSRPSAIAIAGDTLLLVHGAGRLQAFDLRSGKYVWERRLPRRTDGILAVDGIIYLAGLDPERRAALRAATAKDDPVRYTGPYPWPYGGNRMVDDVFSHVQFARLSRDSAVFGFHASDYLYYGRIDGAAYDSVRVARRIRNGARPDLIARMKEDPRLLQEHAYSLSAPWSVTRLSNGRFAYVTVDQRLLPGRMAGRLHVSVVDPVSKQTCADAHYPGGEDPPAWPVFRGDTLVVMQQDEGVDMQPRSIVRKWILDTEGCRWRR